MATLGEGPVTPQEEQVKWLQEASTNVKRNAFYMKRAVDEDNMREALKYSAGLLVELRTSLLTPQKYFELYMQAFDELRHLEAFFKEHHTKGRSYADLYELVQHAGSVLPRLYLLCTVGSCYIRSKEAAAKEILKDLVEMCKGVQHPTRGLFLRSYLCQVSRGLLPDAGSEYEGEGGDINDAIDFLLVNFTEMNKLWVRMQHQGSQRDKDRREKERQQLADLVGKNLTYLSQLDGLDFTLYKDVVLPRIMEQIVSCKDDIAQQYLMQCVIQGFPDEFHLGTLETLLGACPELQSGVKVHIILASLLDRLARYAQTDPSVVDAFNKADAFGQLNAAASKVATQQAEMPAADVAAMYIALLGFTGSVYPDRLDSVDQVLAATHAALQSRATSRDARAEKQLVALLSIPLDKFDVVTVLGLNNYPHVMGLLAPATQKEMAVKIVQVILKNTTRVTSVEKVDMLFDFINPLIVDVEGTQDDTDEEDFADEQSLIARLIHQFHSEDTDVQHQILTAAHKRFLKGGPRRLKHTLPPLAFLALQTVQRIKAREEAGDALDSSCKTVLQFTHGLIAALAAVPMAETALQLFLAAAYSASEVARLELIAYEFFEQAFILYEEDIPDSRSEVTALQSIVGCLHRCRVFSAESRETLVHKATGYSGKLLKKPDQCRAVCSCSHLFWQDIPEGEDAGSSADGVQPPVRDADAVMVCLKRALKIANAAQQQSAVALKASDTSHVCLFVDILNHYLYYFEQGNTNITPSVLQSLLELVSNEMANDHCKKDAALEAFYRNTLKHIAWQKKREDGVGKLYEPLQI
ncbi:hypothetical protein WJX72_006449 [[Myrmecia] bisecta]|uniref:Vacuolar protein sorting-associated protein 35 n=1 Tax=[Myrmecia] bisecta TaxID=41462 RepID=A0AAW1PJ92_9CHLO